MVIDDVRVMWRHHHTSKLSRENGRNRRRRRRLCGTGVSRKLEARLVVLEVLHHPGHDVIRELTGGQRAAQGWVDRLSCRRGRCLSSVQLLPVLSGLDCVSKDGIETHVRGKEPCRPLTSIIHARKA